MQNWKLELITPDQIYPIKWSDLEKWTDETVPVEDYVLKGGEAVYLTRVFQELSIDCHYEFASFIANDGFEQRIPMAELHSAFLLYKQKGEPLKKGYPVRLYVPGYESDCLNVKSVVRIVLA
ncbi:MAG TPA: molybdopterin-dependent oxidoreductase [Bacillota bacterium]|nr:molybdopterin-dependent oxidoreductase [Bacillota bacterium]